MSVEALAVVLHHSKATGTAKLVLIGIANQDGDGGSFPKAATLAKYANVHPRRIPETLQRLVDLGELRIHEREGGGRNLPEHLRPNMYEILVTCPEGCDRTKQHREYDEDGDLVTYSRAQKGPVPKDRKGSKQAVDNSRLPSAENSTSAAGSTTPSAAGSTTKNHPYQPSLEPRLAHAVVSPAAEAQLVTCLACGHPKPIPRGRYCSSCAAAGLDSPILNCAIEGCDITGRRRFPGQQYILCSEHKTEARQA